MDNVTKDANRRAFISKANKRDIEKLVQIKNDVELEIIDLKRLIEKNRQKEEEQVIRYNHALRHKFQIEKMIYDRLSLLKEETFSDCFMAAAGELLEKDLFVAIKRRAEGLFYKDDKGK